LQFTHKICFSPYSKGLENIGYNQHTGDRNEQKIGIGKCKNIHINTTLKNAISENNLVEICVTIKITFVE